MRKLILTLSMVIVLVLATVGPAFAGVPDDYELEGENCLGKMVSGQAKDHGGFKHATEDHGAPTLKGGMNGSKGVCEALD